ncbi:MAG: polyprenyl synthetase family protein [Candidatus Eremiobacteraeota bacterium]|nr:polyprenyl synthetase family protein [Candidatus Eremiobacteraeota bacterium]
MTSDLEQYFLEKSALVNRALESYFPAAAGGLSEVMAYSVLSPGKRFRPALMIAAAESLGLDASEAMAPACAMECIHCFSLIHDDLPSMDNDDFRRGKPSCHRRFGEAPALLAGDALMLRAFEIIAEWGTGDPRKALGIIGELSGASGSAGMTGGQYLEYCQKEKTLDRETLLEIHRQKTGALITVSLRIGVLIAGGGAGDMEALTGYGKAIGLLFQIRDDIIDAGHRREAISFPALYGVEGAQAFAEETAKQALGSLASFTGRRERFEAIVQYLLLRKR